MRSPAKPGAFSLSSRMRGCSALGRVECRFVVRVFADFFDVLRVNDAVVIVEYKDGARFNTQIGNQGSKVFTKRTAAVI